MKKNVNLIILLVIFSNRVSAQDPTLPPTNLGMVNVFDGIGGKPGFALIALVEKGKIKVPANYGTSFKSSCSSLFDMSPCSDLS